MNSMIFTLEVGADNYPDMSPLEVADCLCDILSAHEINCCITPQENEPTQETNTSS